METNQTTQNKIYCLRVSIFDNDDCYIGECVDRVSFDIEKLEIRKEELINNKVEFIQWFYEDVDDVIMTDMDAEKYTIEFDIYETIIL